jgi:hypothetical protein
MQPICFDSSSVSPRVNFVSGRIAIQGDGSEGAEAAGDRKVRGSQLISSTVDDTPESKIRDKR